LQEEQCQILVVTEILIQKYSQEDY